MSDIDNYKLATCLFDHQFDHFQAFSSTLETEIDIRLCFMSCHEYISLIFLLKRSL